MQIEKSTAIYNVNLGFRMAYIVKLLDTGKYFVAGEDGVDTTDSRQEALENGQFEDYESAKETAETWSGDMILDRDFSIESA